MNKRARMRLIGVTAIIIIAVLAIFFGLGNRQAAYYKTVTEISEQDSSLVGERIKVGGAVVAGSWDKQSNPMRFVIRDENDESGSGPTVKVVYEGPVPSTFGDGVTAIVTGELADGGQINATEMITKCPSKYESAKGAMPLADLPESQELDNVTTTGYVKAGTIVPPGGGTRFVVTADATGGREVAVVYEGALPDGMADGSQVVIKGNLMPDGTFEATDVAIATTQ